MTTGNYQPFTPDAEWMRKKQFWYRRYLADGVDYNDIVGTMAQIGHWEEWCERWSATGRSHEERGEKAIREGNTVTAGDAFLRASMCYHVAQLFFFSDLDQKAAAQKQKEKSYRKGMSYFAPPAERVEIPFRSSYLPGYLRVAGNGRGGRVVIFTGGLDSTKEDNHFFENLCLQRGVSTLSLDGPGQGETWDRWKMGEGFEEAISAAVDYLQGRPEVDRARIGYIGRSMGGYYAPKAAAKDHRLKACVCWGVVYDLGHWDEVEKRAWAGDFDYQLLLISLQHAYGARDLKETAQIARSISLEGQMGKVRQPLLLVHGKLDEIIPYHQAERMAREVAGPVDVHIGEDCIHCCHNHHYRCRAMMADWLARTL